MEAQRYKVNLETLWAHPKVSEHARKPLAKLELTCAAAAVRGDAVLSWSGSHIGMREVGFRNRGLSQWSGGLHDCVGVFDRGVRKRQNSSQQMTRSLVDP